MKTAFSIYFFFITNFAFAALSPWHQAYNELKVLEKDSCLKVSEPELDQKTKTWVIAVNVCSMGKARAWEAIVSSKYKTQNGLVIFKSNDVTAVAEKIVGDSRKARLLSVLSIVRVAVADNSFFSDIHNTDCLLEGCFYPYSLTIEMKPEVIQTFVDNVNDIYGMKTITSQEHFFKIINQKIDVFSVGFTTKP